MNTKKTRPVIGKLITSGHRSGFLEVGTSPRTPLEFKVLSPRGIINCDMGGVGLGIVAALEKSSDNLPAKKPTFCCHNPIRSHPIPVNPARNVGVVNGDVEIENETGSLEEEYTIVTCHKPNKSYTKVYHGGCVYEGHVTKNGIEINGMGRHRSRQGCIFDISPARFGDEKQVYQASDFLSSCHLCKKKLHGKDIYMYRGEKAFCSPECRYRQIGMEEKREKYFCSSEASVDVSSSPQMLSTGIFAI